MGKNLRGKELGKGLSQRKDGKYSARFISISGKRIEKYFDGIHEAERWLADARETDSKNGIGFSPDITYNERFENIVFLNRNGQPLKNSSYDTYIYRTADKAGIDRLSMHTLRHTFATRCIEGGMKPKTLQQILGHSNIGIKWRKNNVF